MSDLRRDLADAARSLASAIARLSLEEDSGEWEVVADPLCLVPLPFRFP